jgi:hypothetical protein
MAGGAHLVQGAGLIPVMSSTWRAAWCKEQIEAADDGGAGLAMTCASGVGQGW